MKYSHIFLCTFFPLVFLAIFLSVIMTKATDSLLSQEWWSLLCVSVILLLVALTVIIIWRHPQSTSKAAFMVWLQEFLVKIQTTGELCWFVITIY